ncbi:MAG: PQQ-dependent dehydrogenase, methanol/ethanol family [Bryobacterales bacterium]
MIRKLYLFTTVAALFTASAPLMAQGSHPGRTQFETRCAGCHGGDGDGGEHAGSIIARLFDLDDPHLKTVIQEGLPTRGMPPFQLPEDELDELVHFLRTLRPPQRGPGVHAAETISVRTTDGKTIRGTVLGRGPGELQLRGEDGKIHLFRSQGEQAREVTSQVDWRAYDGKTLGYRYTEMDQIDKSNISRLAPAWLFNFSSSSHLQTTPVIADGVMYVTSGNECYALDAGSGRELWHFQQPLTEGLIGNARGNINRGVAVAGDRLFMVTDHAHLLALDRSTGEVLWNTQMADWRQNYNATGAPLVVNDLVVSGTAGGEEGVRGFVAAYDQKTGKEVWRFWTVPLPGEPGSETWDGVDIEHGGATTWMTGGFDPELNLVYWPTGNAGPDLNGDRRKGDNLYSSSILALDAKTGKLTWHYQFTPHDEWDWDATQPSALVDAKWNGRDRKLMLHADRNGFFYVLDRTNGELLHATPLVEKLTWASGIGADGRPIERPNQRPTEDGTEICPALIGAANWYSTSYNPGTGLYYVNTMESCAVFSKRPVEWKALESFWGGSTRRVPGEEPQMVLRAIDPQTGKFAWELPQEPGATGFGGVLSTASGLVFVGDASGAFVAADAATGKRLWSFPTNQRWRASPSTYMFDGKQYVVVASGPTIVAFALTE